MPGTGSSISPKPCLMRSGKKDISTNYHQTSSMTTFINTKRSLAFPNSGSMISGTSLHHMLQPSCLNQKQWHLEDGHLRKFSKRFTEKPLKRTRKKQQTSSTILYSNRMGESEPLPFCPLNSHYSMTRFVTRFFRNNVSALENTLVMNLVIKAIKNPGSVDFPGFLDNSEEET